MFLKLKIHSKTRFVFIIKNSFRDKSRKCFFKKKQNMYEFWLIHVPNRNSNRKRNRNSPFGAPSWIYFTKLHGGFNLIEISHKHTTETWSFFFFFFFFFWGTYWSRKRVCAECPLRTLKLQLFRIDWNLPRNRTSYDTVDLHPLPDNSL